ncbi:MAG: phosphate ABC transporter substrate-binding protein PstS [Steroidobacteraceae bacterium]
MPSVKSLTLAAAVAGIAAAGIAAPGTSSAGTVTLSGAGATFPYPVYAKWAAAYERSTGVELNYQSIGSGAGIRQIEARTVAFGASDMPLEPARLEAAGLLQFPAIIGGAVPVVHIRGVGPGQLLLDGPTLAAIYLGEITTWNDPRIERLNPGLRLPATAIAPVYRSDGSGTNFLFTDYLCKMSPGFARNVGSSTSVAWPAGIGAKGNEGVANMTGRIDGAIGYVEFAFAVQNHMAYVRLVNRAGRAVVPSVAAFQAAAANADWAHADHYHVVLTDQPGGKSWPITGASFVLVYRHPPDAATTAEVLAFFDWAFRQGGEMARALDYVPLPAGLVTRIEHSWRTEIEAHGAPVWTH